MALLLIFCTNFLYDFLVALSFKLLALAFSLTVSQMSFFVFDHFEKLLKSCKYSTSSFGFLIRSCL